MTDSDIILLVSEVEAWEERPLVLALARTGSFGQRMANVSKQVRWIFEYLYGSNCCTCGSAKVYTMRRFAHE